MLELPLYALQLEGNIRQVIKRQYTEILYSKKSYASDMNHFADF